MYPKICITLVCNALLREIEKKIGHTSQLSFCDLLPCSSSSKMRWIIFWWRISNFIPLCYHEIIFQFRSQCHLFEKLVDIYSSRKKVGDHRNLPKLIKTSNQNSEYSMFQGIQQPISQIFYLAVFAYFGVVCLAIWLKK